MVKNFSLLFIFTVLLFSFNLAFSRDRELPKRKYYATRLDSLVPVIDGKLDDPCWAALGKWGSAFTQYMPEEGGAASQKTSFKILYDDKYLYFAYRAFDNEPDKMTPWLARRDALVGDMGGFALDSYFDHRTAREFNMTAAGAKIDIAHLDNGNEWIWDTAWNGVWEGKSVIEDSAWTCEMRVPFSQLRFPQRDEHVWGMHVWRWIERFREESQWQLLPRTGQGGVHYFGELHGISGIKMPKRIELMPYVRGKAERFEKEAGNPFATGSREASALGLDGKIGLGSNVTLDFTFNPDFGQVEADPSVVNLTTFETFFQERRPFFIEGRQSVLNFGSGDEMLYYSRRIGRQPSYSPELEDDEYSQIPENTTIINALKLTGRSDNGWVYGVLQSVTASEKADIYSNGTYQHPESEPLTNYALARVQKELNQGQTVVGGILTAVNRRINDTNLNFLPRAAYTGGVDFRHQFANRTWYVNSNLMGSYLQGHEEAMVNIQRASQHYYQRVDADYLSVDSSATSLTGNGGHVEIGKGAGKIIGAFRFSWLSPGLELNDFGYLKNTDNIRQTANITYRQTQPQGLFRSYSFSLRNYFLWNYHYDYMHGTLELQASCTLNNMYNGHIILNRSDYAYETRLLRGGPKIIGDKYWYLHYHLFTDSRKPLHFSFGHYIHRYDHGGSMQDQYAVSAGWRVTNALNISSSVSYTDRINDMQYVTTENFISDQRYILGRLNQETLSTTFRIDWSLSPDLSIQYYGQPFVSAGHYDRYRYVTNPSAASYDDRWALYSGSQIRADAGNENFFIDETGIGSIDYEFENPDFNMREFLSNLVIRWEYKPGSAFYLVWSQNRSSWLNHGLFAADEDLDGLFSIRPHDIFMVKVSYWFSM